MMQGDAYDQGIEILDEQGQVVQPTAVADVEILLGDLKKTYAAGQLKFGEKCWLFPITQEESLMLSAGTLEGQVRVKWSTGEVTGCRLLPTQLLESRSREVL